MKSIIMAITHIVHEQANTTPFRLGIRQEGKEIAVMRFTSKYDAEAAKRLIRMMIRTQHQKEVGQLSDAIDARGWTS